MDLINLPTRLQWRDRVGLSPTSLFVLNETFKKPICLVFNFLFYVIIVEESAFVNKHKVTVHHYINALIDQVSDPITKFVRHFPALTCQRKTRNSLNRQSKTIKVLNFKNKGMIM